MSPSRDTDIGDAELKMPDLFMVVNIPKMFGLVHTSGDRSRRIRNLYSKQRGEAAAYGVCSSSTSITAT
jgi:hypothetical protein